MSRNTLEERSCQATTRGITPETLNTILAEVGAKPTVPSVSSDVCQTPEEKHRDQKCFDESKRLIQTFKEKLSNYPKYLSYEGSVVLCVMISIGETHNISLSGMPQIDRDFILAQLPPDAVSKMSTHDATLSVEFDDTKDFVLTYSVGNIVGYKMTVFNSVLHPQKQPGTEVPVEQDGDTVKVGSALILDQRRIQKLVGAIPHEKKRDEDDDSPRRQPVAGRNAYEIRADVLSMAIEWSTKNNSAVGRSDDSLIALAKKLYQFVENRR